MAHAFVVVDCPPDQHKKLVKSINSRAYDFNKKRAGYNISHISEVKLYNIRAKKEVLPFFLNDLRAHNVLDQSFIDWALPLSNEHKQGIKQRSKSFFLKSCLRIVRFVFGRLNIYPAVKADCKHKNFVDGWHYTYCLGIMNDPERGEGEEL